MGFTNQLITGGCTILYVYVDLYASFFLASQPQKNVIGQHRKISQARWGHSDLIKDKLAVKLKSLDSPLFFLICRSHIFREKGCSKAIRSGPLPSSFCWFAGNHGSWQPPVNCQFAGSSLVPKPGEQVSQVVYPIYVYGC